MPTIDLFSEIIPDSDHGLTLLSCRFSASFWDEVVARMLASHVPLTAQVCIVPDGSMALAYRQAWARHTQRQARASVVPPMMTLMNWARANGADDWDAQHTERTLAWMQSLPTVPALMQVLGHSAPEDVMGLARQLIGMSDELSVHLLAGRDVAWVKKSVSEVIEQLYADAGHHLAQEELQVLLHCWSADVASVDVSAWNEAGTSHPIPVVQYLATLRALADAPPYAQVWVLRNRAWTAHEVDFWQRYAAQAQVTVLDVAQIEVHADAGAERAQALQAIAQRPERYVVSESVAANISGEIVQVYAAPSIEDEAQAVVQQVLAWLKENSEQRIALVALDRQVSRRVWALLQRAGVDIRDDTGWLLSTSRAASAWRTGLQLMQSVGAEQGQGKVLAADVLDWLAHPLVLGQLSSQDKADLVKAAQQVADQQVQYQKTEIWQTWSDWQHAVHQYSDCAALHELVQQAHALSKQWTRPRSLSQWALAFESWARQFGLSEGLNVDGAGQVWVDLLTRWSGVLDSWALPLASALKLMSTEVEALTYRPERALEGRAEAVVLMPLGNTRLRLFDAVWLMGADAGNLPSSQMDLGLLNTAVRRSLGLPNVEEQQAVLREALLDVLALNARVCASYCTLKDGAPNGLSPWLQQYLRASHSSTVRIEHSAPQLIPQVGVQGDIASVVRAHVPTVVSATGLSRLAACPYQYYAREVLDIAPIAEPEFTVAANEVGNAWHSVVERFHKQRNAASTEQDEAVFAQCIEAVLSARCAENPRFWALYPLLNSYVASFVRWWQAREAEGWHPVHSEYSPELRPTQTILDASGASVHSVQYKGRIDQVDSNGDGLALIDYKTNGLSAYKKRVAEDEDVQLAFYVNLISESVQQPIIDALYVGVEKNSSKVTPQVSIGTPEDVRAKAEHLRAQVNTVFAQMCAGEPLRALGQLQTCTYCDYRAVCRKDYALADKAPVGKTL